MTAIISALPLTFLEFSGRLNGQDAHLTWSTQHEFNTSYFLVERSFDGVNYSPAGTVNAVNTTGVHHYQLTDPGVLALAQRKVYYRVKQVDIDSRSSYSQVVLLTKDESSALRIFPNPVHETFMLTINSDRPTI